MEIENKIELSDIELLQLMVCYRAVIELSQDWVPDCTERRLILLGLMKAIPIGVGYAISLTDKGTRFLEEHHPAELVEFLAKYIVGGPGFSTLYDSYHVNRLLKLFRILPVRHLVELLVSEEEFIRGHAIRRLEQISAS